MADIIEFGKKAENLRSERDNAVRLYSKPCEIFFSVHSVWLGARSAGLR